MGKLLRLTYSVMRLDGSEIRSIADRLPFVPMAGSSEYRGNGKNYIRGEKGRFAGSRPAGGGSGSGGSAGVDKSAGSGIIKEVKTLSIKGEIHIPPKKINADALSFDSNHISQRGHNVSYDEAKAYVKKAKFSVCRWNGQYENYYSKEGAAFVNILTNEIKTAFSKDEFTDNIIKALEVLDKYGR